VQRHALRYGLIGGDARLGGLDTLPGLGRSMVGEAGWGRSLAAVDTRLGRG
jgi:hypothetical protein